MFCKKCGTPLQEGQIYCHRCGASCLPDQTAEQPNAQPYGQPYAQPYGQPYYQQPYAQPPAPVEKKPNPLAPTGFAFGIVSLVVSVLIFAQIDATIFLLLTFVFSIPGIVLSAVGLARSRKTNTGMGFAIAGLVLSLVAIVIGAFIGYLVLVVLFALFSL